jgi:antitoxin ChpS
MPKAALQEINGTVMVAVPDAFLQSTGLGRNATVEWTVEGGRLVIGPETVSPKYSLEELLAECDPAAQPPEPDPDWTAGPPRGRELI